jgi:hypothetical protein
MSCRTCCRNLSLVFALLATVILAAPAFAAENQLCIQNEFNVQQGVSRTNTAASNRLNCTANDVRVAKVNNIRGLDGNVLGTGVCDTTNGPCCISGTTFSFIADFEVVTSSQSSRSNVGMYIVTDGTTVADALSVNKSCADNIIPPPSDFASKTQPFTGDSTGFTCANSTVKCGSNYFDELDPAPPADNCGDSSSSDAGVNTDNLAGAQTITLEVTGYTCTPPAGQTTLVLPNCTSWQVPGKTLQCVGPIGAQSYPTKDGTVNGIPEAVPGDKSKCNCEVIPLGITAVTPVVTITKTCSSTDTPVAATSCSSGIEGQDEVTYHVEIDNSTSVGTITVTSLTDSVYGDIAGTCPSASPLCTADSTTCNVLPVPVVKGTPFTCTFTAHKTGDPATATVSDTVTASGTSQFGGGWGPIQASATATPVEATATASVTKNAPATVAACATVQYTVDVENTTATTYDETETLSGLSDSFYTTITAVGGNVLGTNCNQASYIGDGSAATGFPGGLFSSAAGTIAPGGSYKCTFEGQFCQTLNNGCISQPDTVTATLTGDETGDTVPGATNSNQITVKECLLTTVTSN